MDALAGLAFGIVIVNVIRGLGVEQEDAVAGNTVRAGIFSSILMAGIYLLVTVVGAQSRGVFPREATEEKRWLRLRSTISDLQGL